MNGRPKWDKPYKWPRDGDEDEDLCRDCGEEVYFRPTKNGYIVAISSYSQLLHRTECSERDEDDD